MPNEKVQYRNKAVELRVAGNTYAEILKQIPVSKGTLSNWLAEIALPADVSLRLSKRRSDLIKSVRAREVTIRKASAVVRRGFAERDAKKDFLWHARKPFFEIGLGIILAGGVVGKASWSYMTANPTEAKLVVLWVKRFMDLPAGKLGIRLYLPRSYDLGTSRVYWSKETGLPAAAFKKPVITPEHRRKPRFSAGVARIEVGGQGSALRLRAWLDLLVVRYAE